MKEGARVSAEANKDVVRRLIEEVWNDHDLTNIDEVVAGDHFEHMAVPEHRHGIKSARHVMSWLFAVFPNHRFDIEDAVADGDRVAVRGTCGGTHEGELWGIPPTGKRFAVQQVHWFRVADGKVAEHWAVRDDLGMMRQLGVVPTQRHSEEANST
jgi:steroid delta-isomerase-like uncharacterized protein